MWGTRCAKALLGGVILSFAPIIKQQQRQQRQRANVDVVNTTAAAAAVCPPLKSHVTGCPAESTNSLDVGNEDNDDGFR